MRDWMERHLHWRVLGLIDWPAYRLFGRCLPCDRLMVLHSPWALYVCERTPLPIQITEQGMKRLAEEAALADLPDTDWQVVPVSQASA
jgi:hypothetical protein